MMTEELHSFETLVFIYQITWGYIREDRYSYAIIFQNFKYYIFYLCPYSAQSFNMLNVASLYALARLWGS